MSETNYLARFRQSYAEVQEFHRKWLTRIQKRCIDDPQRRAALNAWARYSMSIRTVERLLDPFLLPDVYVICRGCIEFDVTLEAVRKDAEYANEYLEFDKHAIAKYAKLFKQSDSQKYAKFKAEFKERYEEDLEKFGMDSWCRRFNGITGLMRTFDRFVDLYTYSLLCNFAHSSVLAMQALSGNIDSPPMSLASVLRSTYGHYLDSTCKFVEFIWQPLDSAEGEVCRDNITRIAVDHCSDPTAQFQAKRKMGEQREQREQRR